MASSFSTFGNVTTNWTINTQGALQNMSTAINRMKTTANAAFGRGLLPLGKITGDFSKFRDSVDSATARVLAFTATTSLLYGTAAAFRRLTSDAIKVESAMTRIGSITGTTGTKLKEFQQGIFRLANETSTSFEDAADAAEEFSRQGYNLTQTLDATKAALAIAKLSGDKAKSTIEGLTATIVTFGDKAGTFTDVAGKLLALDTKFATSASGIIQGLTRVAGVAQQAGFTFDETASALTALKQETGRSEAVLGNSLKSILTSLQSEKVIKDLRAIGVEVEGSDGSFRNMVDVVRDLSKAFDQLGDSQQAAITQKVAGKYQSNAFTGLLKAFRDNGNFDKALKVSGDSKGQLDKRLEAIFGTSEAGLQRLSNKITEFGAKVGSKLSKPIVDAFSKSLTTILDSTASLFQENGKGLGDATIAGIVNVLKGPGAILLGAAVVQLFKRFSSDAAGAFKSLLSINVKKEQNLAIDQAANSLLRNMTDIERQRIANLGTVAEKQRAITLELEKQLNVATEIGFINNLGFSASNLSRGQRSNLTKGINNIKNRAGGSIPEKIAMYREEMAISQGVGGARRSAKPKAIKANVGDGVETIVVNTDEKVIKNFAGSGQDAILNRKMMGYAEGYIPNFASGKRSNNALRKLGFSITKGSQKPFTSISKLLDDSIRDQLNELKQTLIQREKKYPKYNLSPASPLVDKLPKVMQDAIYSDRQGKFAASFLPAFDKQIGDILGTAREQETKTTKPKSESKPENRNVENIARNKMIRDKMREIQRGPVSIPRNVTSIGSSTFISGPPSLPYILGAQASPYLQGPINSYTSSSSQSPLVFKGATRPITDVSKLIPGFTGPANYSGPYRPPNPKVFSQQTGFISSASVTGANISQRYIRNAQLQKGYGLGNSLFLPNQTSGNFYINRPAVASYPGYNPFAPITPSMTGPLQFRNAYIPPSVTQSPGSGFYPQQRVSPFFTGGGFNTGSRSISSAQTSQFYSNTRQTSSQRILPMPPPGGVLPTSVTVSGLSQNGFTSVNAAPVVTPPNLGPSKLQSRANKIQDRMLNGRGISVSDSDFIKKNPALFNDQFRQDYDRVLGGRATVIDSKLQSGQRLNSYEQKFVKRRPNLISEQGRDIYQQRLQRKEAINNRIGGIGFAASFIGGSIASQFTGPNGEETNASRKISGVSNAISLGALATSATGNPIIGAVTAGIIGLMSVMEEGPDKINSYKKSISELGDKFKNQQEALDTYITNFDALSEAIANGSKSAALVASKSLAEGLRGVDPELKNRLASATNLDRLSVVRQQITQSQNKQLASAQVPLLIEEASKERKNFFLNDTSKITNTLADTIDLSSLTKEEKDYIVKYGQEDTTFDIQRQRGILSGKGAFDQTRSTVISRLGSLGEESLMLRLNYALKERIQNEELANQIIEKENNNRSRQADFKYLVNRSISSVGNSSFRSSLAGSESLRVRQAQFDASSDLLTPQRALSEKYSMEIEQFKNDFNQKQSDSYQEILKTASSLLEKNKTELSYDSAQSISSSFAKFGQSGDVGALISEMGKYFSPTEIKELQDTSAEQLDILQKQLAQMESDARVSGANYQAMIQALRNQQRMNAFGAGNPTESIRGALGLYKTGLGAQLSNPYVNKFNDPKNPGAGVSFLKGFKISGPSDQANASESYKTLSKNAERGQKILAGLDSGLGAGLLGFDLPDNSPLKGLRERFKETQRADISTALTPILQKNQLDVALADFDTYSKSIIDEEKKTLGYSNFAEKSGGIKSLLGAGKTTEALKGLRDYSTFVSGAPNRGADLRNSTNSKIKGLSEKLLLNQEYGSAIPEIVKNYADKKFAADPMTELLSVEQESKNLLSKLVENSSALTNYLNQVGNERQLGILQSEKNRLDKKQGVLKDYSIPVEDRYEKVKENTQAMATLEAAIRDQTSKLNESITANISTSLNVAIKGLDQAFNSPEAIDSISKALTPAISAMIVKTLKDSGINPKIRPTE